MKGIVPCLLLAVALAAGSRAEAKLGTIDNVPAATLLLPYFEVDLDNPNGSTTVFTINNASASAAVAHVTLWTNWSVPTFAFDVYLTGYDRQTIDLRDIFDRGRLPQTADAGTDPRDDISNKGFLSQDINFPGSGAVCDGPIGPIPAAQVHIRAAHTGAQSPLTGRCAGMDLEDNIARGYITIDSVTQCAGAFMYPSTPGYFTGIADYRNILWGNYTILDRAQNGSIGDILVPIEATFETWNNGPVPPDPEFSTDDQYTFYGRYVGWTAADQRETVFSTSAVRYLQGGIFDQGTDLILWRDTKVNQTSRPCGSLPVWYPLELESFTVFDEEENTVEMVPDGFGGYAYPYQSLGAALATNRTNVGSSLFVIPFGFGWLYMNLNTYAVSATGPGEDPIAAQSYTAAFMQAAGRFAVGLSGIQLENAKQSSHTFIVPNGPGSTPPLP